MTSPERQKMQTPTDALMVAFENIEKATCVIIVMEREDGIAIVSNNMNINARLGLLELAKLACFRDFDGE